MCEKRGLLCVRVWQWCAGSKDLAPPLFAVAASSLPQACRLAQSVPLIHDWLRLLPRPVICIQLYVFALV